MQVNTKLLTLAAMPYLSRINRAPTVEDFDDALGAGYRVLEAQLPFEEACDLYCDLDAHWETYRTALENRFLNK